MPQEIGHSGGPLCHKESVMANKRTILVQGLSLNAVNVGGLASLGFSGAFKTVPGRADGALGIQEVSRHGQSVDFNMSCADVTNVNALLAAVKADTTFYVKESGLATWHKYILPNTTAWIVLNRMSLLLSGSADGQLDLSGKVSFVDGSKTLADALTLTDAFETDPTIVHPIRLGYPNAVSFNPGSTIAPLHTQKVSLTLTRPVKESTGDNDISEVVDALEWDLLDVNWTFVDASETNGSHIAASLLAASYGFMTVPCVQLGGQTPAKTLTVNNVLWTGMEQREGKDHTEFTMKGQAGWRSAAGVDYKMNAATKLFGFA